MAGAANPAFTSALPAMAKTLPSNQSNPASGGKGGGMIQNAMPAGSNEIGQPVGQPAPSTQFQSTSAPNVYNQSSGAYNAALGLTGQAAGPANVGQFMNPYTSMVTGQTLQDLERQRQMAINTTGQQASQAGAFGGSRHGVAEALTNQEFARQGAQTFGNLQQQGFTSALGAAQQQQSNQLAAANQFSNLANQGFNFGQTIGNQQAQQGATQRAMQQTLIDAARGQFGNYTGYPQQAINLPLQALGMTPYGQTTTSTQTAQPGLFQTLGGVASILGAFSDPRLKTNVKRLGEVAGFNIYVWDWNEEGKKVANPAQPTLGVMADELQATHPHLVHKAANGYLQVDYAGLNREING